MLVKIINEGRKKVTKNDKGEIVSEKCPKCGSEIGLYIQGEPIYRCSNDKCKKYFGAMPCHLNENIKAELIKARKEINTNPTEKQKEAGNYKMGHINIMGFEITLENPKGSYRKGKDRNGKEWKTLMHYDYGYFTKTLGYDGDAVDVFIGNNLKSDKIFAIDQFINGKFDETKFMLGFNNKTQAKQAYLSNYEKNWKGFKEITEITVDDFKKWLYNGKQQRKPFYQYKTLKNVFITEKQMNYIKMVLNESINYEKYAKESLKQSIENRDLYENNPDGIRFFNKEYSYYADSYDDENIIEIIPFILADYPLIGKTFKFGEPGTAHNSIRLQLKKIYEKMPLEILQDAFNIDEPLTKDKILSKIVYKMIQYENDGRLYIIRNPWEPEQKICIFTFWTEDMTISINDFVEYVISKKPEIKECDLILIANNENPYIIYDNKNKISLDNNHEQQILHNLPAKEKWEQMQDFRNERDKIIGNKLAKRDINGNKTGKEMTQAEYNNLKYGYVAENKKAQN